MGLGRRGLFEVVSEALHSPSKIEVYKRVQVFASAEFQRHLFLGLRVEGEFRRSNYRPSLLGLLAHLRVLSNLASEPSIRQRLLNRRRSQPNKIRTAPR